MGGRFERGMRVTGAQVSVAVASAGAWPFLHLSAGPLLLPCPAAALEQLAMVMAELAGAGQSILIEVHSSCSDQVVL